MTNFYEMSQIALQQEHLFAGCGLLAEIRGQQTNQLEGGAHDILAESETNSTNQHGSSKKILPHFFKKTIFNNRSQKKFQE